jgi:hypothetical protein
MVKNENLIKLKELTEKISKDLPNTEYKSIIKELKTIINKGEEEIYHISNPTKKLACYEKLCSSMNNFLNNLKID